MWDSFAEFEFSIIAVIQNLRTPFGDIIMKLMNFFGNAGLIWIFLSAICLAFKKYRKLGLNLAVSLMICLLLNNLALKPLIGRERPFVFDPSIELIIKTPGEFSFPSGHTLSSFAAAFVIYKHKKSYGIAAYCFAALMGFSRVYLQVHYPSDVIFGAVIGLAFGALACFLARRFIYKNP